MNDVFKEQMVRQSRSTADKALSLGATVAAFIIVFFVFALLDFTFGLLAGIAVGLGLNYLYATLSREYEYILTNGDLDIDCIYGRSRRKRVFSGELKNIEIMAHVSDMGYEDAFKKAVISKDCSDNRTVENTYKFIAPYKGKMMTILFSPNEELLRLMTPYLGQRRLALKK